MTALNNRKIVSNSFNNGIDLDSNPMVISNDCLTSCLNGTLITHNGNEFILQNDMGNGRVESAGLPPGYVPVGMKEFGGIVYVASKNVITGDCQIGTFPSPERNISADEIQDFQIPPVPTIDAFCEGDEIVNDVITTKIYPEPLKPGDKFKVTIPNADRDDSILQYNLGIKVGSGVESRNWEIYNTSNSIDFANDSDYSPFNYEENSKGELYLITKVKLPHDIDVTLTGIEQTSQGNIITYEISGQQNQQIAYKINKDDWNFVNLDSNGIYVVQESLSNEKLITIVVSPIIKSINEKKYKIKSMTKSITTDISQEISGEVKLTQWRYSYDETGLYLDLTYGFSGALKTTYVNFTFYKYYDFSGTFNEFKTFTAEPRRSYSGQFTDVVDVLDPYEVYLCKIQCKPSETSDVIQGEFYRLVWTNDILNQYNLSQEKFDSGYIELNSFTEGTTTIKDPATMKSEYNTSDNKYASSDLNVSQFSFEQRFSKKVEFIPNYKIVVNNVNKLPFGNPSLDSLLEFSYQVSKNNTDSQVYGSLVGNTKAEVSPPETGDIRERTITTDYCYQATAMTKAIQSKGKVEIIAPYLRENKVLEAGELSDMKKIFGYEDGLEMGVGMATGRSQDGKSDTFTTSYGLLYLNKRVDANGDFEAVPNLGDSYGNLATHYKAPGRNYEQADRSWEDKVGAKIVEAIKKQYNYIPPISCLGSFRKYDLTYGGKWMNGKDEARGQIGYQWMDHALISNYEDTIYYNGSSHHSKPYEFGEGYRNYIIPLWYNETDEVYNILIDSATLLTTEHGPKMGMSGGFDPDCGSRIVEPLKDLFSQLYIHDPKLFQEITAEYRVSDPANYSYTMSVSGTIDFTEKINLSRYIVTDSNYQYDIFNRFSDTFVYMPNQKLNNAIKRFFNDIIPDDLNVTLILFNQPNSIENQYQVDVPKASILEEVNKFITASSPDSVVTSGSVKLMHYSDSNNPQYEDKSASGDFDTKSIYVKLGTQFYSINDESVGDNTIHLDSSGVNITLKDLAQYLTVSEIFTVNNIQYKVIYLNSNGMSESDFEQYNNTHGGDSRFKMPYIGLLHTDSESKSGKKDYTEQYPFSFVKGYFSNDKYINNCDYCVPLKLFSDNDRIKLSKN